MIDDNFLVDEIGSAGVDDFGFDEVVGEEEVVEDEFGVGGEGDEEHVLVEELHELLEEGQVELTLSALEDAFLEY